MISVTEFRTILETLPGSQYNAEQWAVVQAPSNQSIHVVAGPGTGKTTSLVGRILKLIFVDQIPAGSILATTFTKKAAEELRSRILNQGMGLKSAIAAHHSFPIAAKDWAAEIDVNQVITGTLDSVCQEILRQFKQPGAADPQPVDDYVASTLMFRDGLLFSGNVSDTDLRALLLPLHGASPYGFTAGRMSRLIEQIYQRWHSDVVNFGAFQTSGTPQERTAKAIVRQIIQRYTSRLSEIGGLDFVQLETEVLIRFRAMPPNNLDAWRSPLRAVIVDEYQDTNLLQESIYFEVARMCRAITVVGDDDQSLYRFRGASVELFTEFPTRVNTNLGVTTSTIFLRQNYRSTAPIVELVNRFAALDASYQTVRVPAPGGGARGVVAASTVMPMFPVLGLFRDNLDDLADELSELVRDVFRGPGRMIPGAGLLVRNPNKGDLGDCCLLASSHREFTSGDKPRIRLPRLLRERLRAMNAAIEVFNPRGQSVADIDTVRIFGGYVAHVVNGEIDRVATSAVGRHDAPTAAMLQAWIDAATLHFSDPATPVPLKNYVQGWFDRNPGGGNTWPRSVSLLEFLNGLQHFFPALHDDPEGQLYYEVFTRQFQACQKLSSYDGDLLHRPATPNARERAAHDLIELLLGPIASGAVGVNEELIESFPQNRLAILSIHQAKGLEFPMVIVDIGSDFKVDSPQQRRDRHPEDGEASHRLESQMRKFSAGLGTPTRSEVNRAFDDLYRKFFVAFSRPEQCLLLVGLSKSRPGTGSLMNVAAGWDRQGVRRWPPTVPITFL
jgi:ATP-dependent DNA helicase UvrD/PcrA